jgi:hypothetical protein
MDRTQEGPEVVLSDDTDGPDDQLIPDDQVSLDDTDRPDELAGDNETSLTDADASRPGDTMAPAGFLPRMFGEIVGRRNPVLIALVLLVALFIAVAPLLFRYQRNSMSDALVVYDTACKHKAAGSLKMDWMRSVSGPALAGRDDASVRSFFESIQCVSRKGYRTALRPVKGREDGPNRAFVLSIFKGGDIIEVEKAKLPVINVFFSVKNERLLIDDWPK